MRAAAVEDRFIYFETGIVTEDVDSNVLVDDINENFMGAFVDEAAEAFNSDDLSGQTEVSNEPSNWQKLLELPEELKQLQPWKWINDDQIFAIQDPETKEYVYCSVMGGGGMEFGLAAFVGMQGVEYLRGLQTEPNVDGKYYLNQRSLLLSFSNRDELSKEDLQLLKEHGKSYRGKNQWPLFRSFYPGFYPWFLDQDEVRLFTLVIEQVIKVSTLAKKSSKLLVQGYLEDFFAREYDHTADQWTNVKISDETYPNRWENFSLHVNELELQQLKRSLKRSDIPLEYDCDYILTPIQEHPNERPYYPRLALFVERQNGLIVCNSMLKNNILVLQRKKPLLG